MDQIESEPEVETAEAAEPEKRYRGVVARISEIKERFLPVQILNEDETPSTGEIKPVRTPWGESPRGNIPRVFILDRVEDNHLGDKVKTLHYFTSKDLKRGTRTVASDTKLSVLTGAVGKTISGRLDKHMEANASTIAGPTGHMTGADPEIFVEHKGAIVPAWTFLGSKASPTPLSQFLGLSAYWDGFQAEWNAVAGYCLMGFCDSIQAGLSEIAHAAKRVNKRAKLTIRNVVEVDQGELAKASEEHVQFGCAPSFNIYKITGAPLNGRETQMRFAGGHIHYGTGAMSEAKISSVVRAMDAILGVACVSLFASLDNPVRRKYYGLAGEYRLPKHGIEYRTLSNAWLCHPVITNLVHDLSRRALAIGWAGLNKVWKTEDKEVIECIQTCDVTKAREILARNKDMLCSLIEVIPAYVGSSELAYRILTTGVESAIKDPGDLETNWLLDGSWKRHCSSPNSSWTGARATLATGKLI